MSRLRIRISLNKGKKGIYLDKLEKIVSETRKFLASIGADIEVPDPTPNGSDWIFATALLAILRSIRCQ